MTSTGRPPSASTAACSLRFLDRREHVLLVGPVGVGKSFLAQALGYAAVRSGHSARFVSADQYFRELAQARVDHSVEKACRSFLAPDLLILDDLGLHRLSAQQSIDLYELIPSRPTGCPGGQMTVATGGNRTLAIDRERTVGACIPPPGVFVSLP